MRVSSAAWRGRGTADRHLVAGDLVDAGQVVVRETQLRDRRGGGDLLGRPAPDDRDVDRAVGEGPGDRELGD